MVDGPISCFRDVDGDQNFAAYFETLTCNGWHDAGPKTVLKEAQDRVAKDGWEGKPDEKGLPRGGARKAISNQVRYVGIPQLNCIACLRALCSFRVWILRAFLLDGIARQRRRFIVIRWTFSKKVGRCGRVFQVRIGVPFLMIHL